MLEEHGDAPRATAGTDKRGHVRADRGQDCAKWAPLRKERLVTLSRVAAG